MANGVFHFFQLLLNQICHVFFLCGDPWGRADGLLSPCASGGHDVNNALRAAGSKRLNGAMKIKKMRKLKIVLTVKKAHWDHQSGVGGGGWWVLELIENEGGFEIKTHIPTGQRVAVRTHVICTWPVLWSIVDSILYILP